MILTLIAAIVILASVICWLQGRIERLERWCFECCLNGKVVYPPDDVDDGDFCAKGDS